MKEFAIRVETLDGDVDYYRLTPDFVYFTAFNALKIDQFAVQRKYYPEFRVNDLSMLFDYVDSSEVN